MTFENFVKNIKQKSFVSDKLSHFILCMLLGFNLTIAITAAIAIELTQIDSFGIKGRVKDTLLDLFADLAGIIVGFFLYRSFLAPLGM